MTEHQRRYVVRWFKGDLGQTGSQWLAAGSQTVAVRTSHSAAARSHAAATGRVQVAGEVETTLTGELTQTFAHNVMVQLVGARSKKPGLSATAHL
ncbi:MULTISPECIES: hypothetical protein [Cupriavidus]|jgi:hypothetical protein|uniref:Uncharacterized protein n=1 Tax=Cupriavidus basilensis TaxID=68895 RepID=A0A643G0H3_9BURK|nr:MULTISPECIES: hypothetical protein [Cupriavidus]NOV23516.1 hypothetical protein [Cupriavidus necator]QOT81598.1 hypothetical protein F7R26_036865 [Cupriavidus basilensis]BDB30201.1 hypothetical protein CTP10_R76180 [Cupriavidus sp. P-10]